MDNKIALTIKEMQKLQSLGLDTSDASMMWVWNAKDDDWICISRSAKNYYWDCMTRYAGYDLPEYISAYTLQDMLKKLPKKIVRADDLTEEYVWKLEEDSISYYNDLTFNHIKVCRYNTSLEASYQMLLWCIENNYIKTNKV